MTSDDDIIKGLVYLIMAFCLLVSFIHYCIVKCIYKNNNLKSKLFFYGFLMAIFSIIFGNVLFRLPMLIIYIFEEKKNGFAAIITIVLSIISCFALSIFTYYTTSSPEYFSESIYLYEDYGSIVLSLGFYPIYVVLFILTDIIYFFSFYAFKFSKFINLEGQVEMTTFHTIAYTLNIVCLIICLYNGNICPWFYKRQKDKNAFLKCILFPSLITTLSFYSIFLYKLGIIPFVPFVLAIISAVLSIYLRKVVLREKYIDHVQLNLSPEKEDELVEYSNDTICLEDFSQRDYYKIKIPNSFAGIKFGDKN